MAGQVGGRTCSGGAKGQTFVLLPLLAQGLSRLKERTELPACVRGGRAFVWDGDPADDEFEAF